MIDTQLDFDQYLMNAKLQVNIKEIIRDSYLQHLKSINNNFVADKASKFTLVREFDHQFLTYILCEYVKQHESIKYEELKQDNCHATRR